jgi:basic membrane protein A
MTGTTGAAFNDPVKGGELAKSQMDRGADVIYHAAGGTGIGVLRAVADAGKLGIGVDSNQNALHPGKVLTSMLKRVDTAVDKTLTDAKNNAGRPASRCSACRRRRRLGARRSQQGADQATMKAAADKAVADIKSGTVKVHDYMSDSEVPGAVTCAPAAHPVMTPDLHI